MTSSDPLPSSSAAALVDFESLPVAALRFVGERIVAVNPAYEALMGVSARAVAGRTTHELVQQFVTSPDQTLVDAAVDEREAGLSPAGHLWCRVTTGDGRTRTLRVEWRTTPHAGEDTGVIFLIDAEGEATAKAVAEALARAGGELVRCRAEGDVLERAVEALAAQGFVATLLLLRDGESLLGYGPTRGPSAAHQQQELIGPVRPPREILTRFNPHFYERRAAFFQDGERLVREAYPAELAERVVDALPGRRMLQAPIFVDDAAYGALVVTSDLLTPALAGALEMFAELLARAIENVRLHAGAASRLEQLERLQAELVERERLAALGEAAAVMAHEVRNPLAAIMNAAAVLTRPSAPQAPTQREMCRVIAEEAVRLERLVSDLLELGRPLSPRPRATELGDVAEAALEVLQGRGEENEVEISVEVAPQGARAVLDPDLVELALLNVLRNAAQASPRGGRVRVRVGAREGWAELSVKDQGPGFSPEVARKMFEPFFTTRATGTGIGLAVVRRIVTASGGTIDVGEAELGGGRMTLRFPAV